MPELIRMGDLKEKTAALRDLLNWVHDQDSNSMIDLDLLAFEQQAEALRSFVAGSTARCVFSARSDCYVDAPRLDPGHFDRNPPLHPIDPDAPVTDPDEDPD